MKYLLLLVLLVGCVDNHDKCVLEAERNIRKRTRTVKLCKKVLKAIGINFHRVRYSEEDKKYYCIGWDNTTFDGSHLDTAAYVLDNLKK